MFIFRFLGFKSFKMLFMIPAAKKGIEKRRRDSSRNVQFFKSQKFLII